jgi:hypothetical protein
MLRPAPSPDQVSWLTDPPTPRPSRHFASGLAGFVPVHSCGAAPAFTGFPSIRAVHGSVAVYLMAGFSREVSGERRSMNGEARCAHALVLPRRQVGDARPAGLLALGSSYSPRLPSPFRPVALAGFVPEYSDGVAADSHRLPYCPLGQLERKATTPYQTAADHAMQPTRAGEVAARPGMAGHCAAPALRPLSSLTPGRAGPIVVPDVPRARPGPFLAPMCACACTRRVIHP